MHESRARHAVVIIGGGPTGLMLAGELALAGVDVAVVERRADATLTGRRAGGLHARTLELLDQRGIVDRFLAQGQVMQIAGFGQVHLDIGDLPTRHNYGLALAQEPIERTLAARVAELGAPVHRGRALTDFTQDDAGVDITLADGATLRADWLVGCDGGRSRVRKRAGVDFPGWDASVSYMIADVELTEPPAFGVRRDEKGTYAMGPRDDGRVGLVLREDRVGHGEPTLDELRAALVALYGTDFGLRAAPWRARFSDATRQAAAYRRGRVLLAGDAAHVHSPIGGQGLNLGLQDAVNLGWKLALVVHGAPARLLDTYHAERHPAGARVLRTTMAQTALSRGDARMDAVRESLAELLAMDEPRRRYGALMSGLDLRYDLGDGHPLLGRRVPDLDVVTADGPRRVFTLLHAARPLLLHLGDPTAVDLGPWTGRVQRLDAAYPGPWELPAVGPVPPPTSALVRPDGHVAWVGDGTDRGLRDALTTWFGPAHVPADMSPTTPA